MGKHSHASIARPASRLHNRQRAGTRPALLDQPRAKLSEDVWNDIVLAQQLYDAQDWDRAYAVIRKFLKRRTLRAQPMTYDALGSCAQFQGRMNVAIQCFRKALAIDPDYVEARNRIIMILDAQPETTATQAQRERAKWWEQHGAHRYATRAPHWNDRDPERPLKVGYVSGDFQYHSAAQVFHRIALEHSDGFIPYFYSNTPYNKYDSITNSYRVMSGWRDVVEWPDALVANRIRDDEIDILVDLSGYTAMNRLLTFCHAPAPIRVTAWGYATGVGHSAMTHLISDRVVIPEDRQHEHVEQIVYLPCVIDYDGTAGLPEPNPLPCLTERPTFGVFQRSLKLNADDCEVWRQVLERLPASRLLMKGHYCPSLQQWMQTAFQDQWAQVEIRGVSSSYDHKLGYQQVDLCLDPWPQTGGVSACDALWMGVPAVTLLGPRVIQRTTASLLTTLGLPDFIAETREDYVAKAVEWVTVRREELQGIRLGLRDRFRASPIHAGYREATETAYRDLWRTWCATPVSIAEARKRLELARAS
jgi:predicted O-linked N-acetylglucosamine transferase (SPINDLY family)